MFPDLIWERQPTSRTGVLPVRFLSSMGPVFGLLSPSLSVSPRMRWAMARRNLSTSLNGSHFRRAMATPNVDMPSISLGRTCTCKQNNIEKNKILINWNILSQRMGLIIIFINLEKKKIKYISSKALKFHYPTLIKFLYKRVTWSICQK